MLRRLAVATSALATATACAPSGDPACLVWPADARPLMQGDSVRLRVGTLVGSDCEAARPQTAVWRALDPAVAAVSSQGTARGLAPGVFRAVGIAGRNTLRAEGFVLPRGWRARITPRTATVRVGDTVTFRMAVTDSAGRALPAVPFSLYTPEFLAVERRVTTNAPQPTLGPDPLTDVWSHQGITRSGVFRAVRPGTTIITGEFAGMRAEARLTILPQVGPPQAGGM